MTRFLSLAVVLVPAVASAAPPAVTAVAFHPQGESVAAGVSGQVRLFDRKNGSSLGTKSVPGRVTALTYDPRGRWLAVACGESGKSGEVRLFQLGPGRPSDLEPFLTLTGHSDAIYALAFSPDGNQLASAGYDRVIQLWNMPVGRSPEPSVLKKPRLTLKDHSDAVYGLSFHPDGLLLASAGADRAVKVWNVASGKRLYTLGDPTDWVYCVSWSPDKKHLAAAGVDKSIRVWAADKDGGKLIHAVFAHEKPVWRLAYSSDGATLFTAGEDRVIKSWDAAKMMEKKVFDAQPDSILDFAASPDGMQLAVARFDGALVLLDSASGKVAHQLLPIKPVPPKAAKLTPNGATRGQATTIIATGADLDHLRRVTTNSPNVTVTIDAADRTNDRVTLHVNAKPTAAIGVVQLTFEGDAGKSAPIALAIDRFSRVHEAGVTDSSRAAQSIKLPATVIGTIDRAGDADFFRFDANAGDEIGVQVIATELGNKLDAVLTLTDSAGTVLAEGGTSLGYRIAKKGTYAIGIRDRDFRGAADFNYRLHIGPVPVVTGVFPLAVQRGRTADVHLEGVNLGAAGGLQQRLNVPSDSAPGTRVNIPFANSPEKPIGAAFVMAAEFPSLVVDPVGGSEVRIPGSADGILTRPNESQLTRFKAKKGERVVVEVLARRAGSPVDSVIEILDSTGKPVPRALLRSTAKTYTTFRDHDSSGPGIRLDTWNEVTIDDYLYVNGELLRILALPKGPDDDCQFYQVSGQRMGFLGTTPAQHSQGSPMYKVEIHPPGKTFPPNGLPLFTLHYRNDDGGPGLGKDSFLIFEAPADDLYQARVSDARGSSGPTHSYRVTIRPPRPDFTVSFNPTAPSIWKGGAIPINVAVTRRDGFDGPVRVELEGLPAGLHAPMTFVEAGHTTTAFALYAEAGASVPSETKLKLVARATIDGKEVIRESLGGLPKLAEPGDIVTRTSESKLAIKPGEETRFVVDIERKGKFSGRVPVEVRGLPHGVRVQNIGLNGILITERETRREVVLYAEPWVKPMEHPIVVLSKSESKNTDHAAKSILLKVEK